MPLVADKKIQLNLERLTVADLDDFRELTGLELDDYAKQMENIDQRGINSWGQLMTDEMRAMLWIFLRDEETRNTVWDSSEQMIRAMKRDLRTLSLSDFENFQVNRSETTRLQRLHKTVEDGLDESTIALLAEHGYNDAVDIAGASDDELLKIKGLGRVKLHQIRAAERAGTL